jgi:hypothetical protein
LLVKWLTLVLLTTPLTPVAVEDLLFVLTELTPHYLLLVAVAVATLHFQNKGGITGRLDVNLVGMVTT